MELFEQIYNICRRIPFGQVATYGQIARLIGNPRLSRQVGWALRVCPHRDVPCHRVVNREGAFSGELAFGGQDGQRLLLAGEGVEVGEGNVDLDRYQWDGQVVRGQVTGVRRRTAKWTHSPG